jgi:dienelactone hydrolase
MALNMARWGLPVDAVVSFHGDLTDPDPKQDAEIKPRILVLTGADDQWVPQQAIESFKQEMRRARADYEVTVYPGAQHSFTNPDADKHNIPNVKYNAEADRQSWDQMQRFLSEVFGK